MFDTFPNFPQKPFLYELAARAEALACKLSNVIPRPPETANRDLVSILQSTCDMLEYLLEQQLMAVADIIDNNQQEYIASAEQPTEEIAPDIIETVAVSSPEHQPVLSATAKELIKLSDWVLFAKAEGTVVQPEVLEEIEELNEEL